MWVELNQTEQKLAHYLASTRYKANRESGAINGKIGPQNDNVTDLEGMGSELAFCKMHNIYPDLDTGNRPDCDAWLVSGHSVDIKATKYPSGHLIAIRSKKLHPPELYALMVGTFPRYRFAGFISATELLQDKNLKDFGYGPSYAVTQQELQFDL